MGQITLLFPITRTILIHSIKNLKNIIKRKHLKQIKRKHPSQIS